MRPNALPPQKGAPHEKPGKARRALAGQEKPSSFCTGCSAKSNVGAPRGAFEIKKSAVFAVPERSKPGVRRRPGLTAPREGGPWPQGQSKEKGEKKQARHGAPMEGGPAPTGKASPLFVLGRFSPCGGKPLARGRAGCVSGWAAGMQAGAGSKRGKPGQGQILPGSVRPEEKEGGRGGRFSACPHGLLLLLRCPQAAQLFWGMDYS